MPKIYTFLLFLFLYLYLPGFSNNPPILFKQITVQDGLSQGVVRDILQDKDGYVWFATYTGLDRYTGESLEVFRADGEPGSLLDDGIVCLYEDRVDRFWVGTSQSIYLYERNSQHFQKVDGSVFSGGEIQVQVIFQDRSGKVWVGTKHGLAYIEMESMKLVPANNIVPQNHSVEMESVRQIIQTHDGDLWFGTDNGIIRFDKDLGKSFRYERGKEIRNMECRHDTGPLCIVVGNILKQWQNGHFQPIVSFENWDLDPDEIRDIEFDERKNLWVATSKGLWLFNEQFELINTCHSIVGDSESLLSNIVRKIYFDSEQRLWVGSMGGVSIQVNSKKPFNYNSLGASNGGAEEEFACPVWEIAQTRDAKRVLVGTLENGLFQFLATDLTSPEKHYVKSQIPFQTVYAFQEIGSGEFLVGGGGGVVGFNPEKQKFNAIFPEDHWFNDVSVFQIEHYKDSLYWLGAESGVFLMDLNKRKIISLDSYLPKSLAPDVIITIAFVQRSSSLWVGTKFGVNKIQIPNNHWQDTDNQLAIERVPLDKKRPGKEVITSFNQTSNGDLWISSNKGAFKYREGQGVVQELTIAHGLIDNFINSAQEDAKENIWFSTNKGISVLYKESGRLVNFDNYDGLKGLEFNNEASCKGAGGRMFFGGINGLTYFYPDSLIIDTVPPRTEITSLALFNEKIEQGQEYNGQVLFEKAISHIDTLILSHKNNFLTISFTSFPYIDADLARYAYRLKGLEENWNKVKGRNEANYSSLPTGTFVFQLKAANQDDIWMKQPRELTIIVEPPFWRQKSVIIMAVVAGLLLIMLYVKLREYHLKRRKNELEKEIEIRTEQIYETQEELRQSLALNEGIVSNAKEGITVISKTGQILFINRAACRMLLYDRSELLEMKVGDLTPVDFREQDRVMMNVLLEDKSVYYEKQLRRKDGVIIDVEVSSSLKRDGDELEIVTIFSDITERKANQRELERYRTQLEFIVEERTHELILQKDKAERADKLKSAFLANMSHEVRTPLNAIVGFSALLKRNGACSSEANEYINYIEQNSQSLNQLIQDIIDLAKLETGGVPLSVSTFELQGMLKASLAKLEVKRKALEKDVALNFYGTSRKTVFVHTDEKRMRQMLEAFLDNALKFTDKGEVAIEVKRFEAEGEVEISVKDTGIGIPKDRQQEIFERFVKIETPEKRLFRGTGLGLSIAKHIGEILGTQIKVKSAPDKGACFYFRLPYFIQDQRESPVVANGSELVPQLKGKNVLLAEDDEPNFLLLNEFLKRTGVNVIWARNGIEVLQHVKNSVPDFIFMDLKMPEKDGMETTRLLRASNVNIPIVALTAYALEHDKMEALQAGCNDYLKKPVHMKEVYEVLQKYIVEEKSS